MRRSSESFAKAQTVEHASQQLQSSSEVERKAGEQTLLEFRQSKSPYRTCLYIIYSSDCPYSLFQAVSVIRTAAIREWSVFSSTDVTELKENVFNWVLTAPNSPFSRKEGEQKTAATPIVPPYVIGQFLHTCAVLTKKNLASQSSSLILSTLPSTSAPTNSAARSPAAAVCDALVHHISDLLAQPEVQPKMVLGLMLQLPTKKLHTTLPNNRSGSYT